MLIDVINFIFVYFVAGFILSLFIRLVAKKAFDNKLTFLLGYGIAPLLISLILYYLYSFFPSKEWIFYALVIYILFVIFFISSIKETRNIQFQKILGKIKNLSKKVFRLDVFKKVLLFFILFVIIFTITRNISYPTIYTDAVEYLKQGFVYSQDHSHKKLLEKETFSNFSKNNPLYGPEEEFQMNKAIRPALPIFYSFFYKNENPSSFNFFSINFLYSYYFLLLVVAFTYIVNRLNPKNVLLGLTFLLSCYFLTKLSYSNYKAIITAFLSLGSLFLLYKIIKDKTFAPAIFLGILCGLMSYINYTGLVISGILFLIGVFALKTNLKQKILTVLIILTTFVLFSGGEIKQYQGFIFKKSFLSSENRDTTYSSEEYINRLEIEGRKNDANFKIYTLVTKKLQAFTQIQFFGFIFWLFLAILILSITKKESLTNYQGLIYLLFSFSFSYFSIRFF